MHLGFYRFYGIQLKGLIGINQNHRDDRALGLDGAFESSGKKFLYLISVAVITAFRENNVPPSLFHLRNHVQNRLELGFHAGLIQPASLNQGNELGGDDLMGAFVVYHNCTGILVGGYNAESVIFSLMVGVHDISP